MSNEQHPDCGYTEKALDLYTTIRLCVQELLQERGVRTTCSQCGWMWWETTNVSISDGEVVSDTVDVICGRCGHVRVFRVRLPGERIRTDGTQINDAERHRNEAARMDSAGPNRSADGETARCESEDSCALAKAAVYH